VISIRHTWKALAGLAIGVSLGGGVTAVARDLGVRDAQAAVARLLGVAPDNFRIRSVSPGPMGGGATVTAQMDVTLQLEKDKAGEWQVASVRVANGKWQDVSELRRALDAEKSTRARVDLDALAAGVEAYRRSRGFLPASDSVTALVDAISPEFQPRVVRLDPWDHPYYYRQNGGAYRLGSPGPDGEIETADDVVLSSGGGA
jgi:hypothetical protein